VNVVHCLPFTGNEGAAAVLRLAASSANPVDLAAVSLRRAAGTAVTNGKQGSERIVAFGWRGTSIVKAIGGDRAADSLRDHFGDVDDPLALMDARFHAISHAHWRGRFRPLAVDAHMAPSTCCSGSRAGLGDPNGVQPLVDAHCGDT